MLLQRQRFHFVVEARDEHATGPRVDAARDHMHELGQRITHDATRDTRVKIRRGGPQRQAERLHAAESSWSAGLPSRHPNRIGDDDRIGLQLLRMATQR